MAIVKISQEEARRGKGEETLDGGIRLLLVGHAR